jgi:Flp pilus assembly protein TadD
MGARRKWTFYSCYMEVAVNPRTSFGRLSFARVTVLALLLAGLGGCGTDIISYNREFRTQAITLYNNQDYINAASAFKQAIREEPGDYTSRYYLGVCYEVMHHTEQAIQEYRTALQVMDGSFEGKGDIAMRQKVAAGLANAIACESDRSGDLAMIERGPKTVENKLMVARIYRKTGDADSALVRYEEAQQLDPMDQIVAKEYGLYLEQLGQMQKADPQLRRAYALNSRDEEVAAALRRLGVVPGPSLKGEDGLERPFVPLGPLPEMDLSSKQERPASPAGPLTPGPVGSNSNSPQD